MMNYRPSVNNLNTILFRTASLLLLLACPALLLAQTTEDIRKKFPGEEAVILNNSKHYSIRQENGALQVNCKDLQQILYLSENPSAYMSRYGFSQSGFHEVTDYEAYTTTPERKKIKVTDFKTSDNTQQSIFYDDVKETNFDFPALSSGAIGTLEMNIRHKEPRLLSPFYFSRNLPVIHSELKISFPKDMNIRYILKGNNKELVTVKEDQRRNEKTLTFLATDVPGEKRYGDAADEAYYDTHVIFFIENYKDDKGAEVRVLSNLDDLHRMNFEHIRNINKDPGNELRHLVDSLTKSLSDPELKARAIYGWVQDHIKYVAFENGMEGFVPREAALVCNRRFGDCKDMSSILTVMMKLAGIQSYYTWIGTRSIPYDYTEVHTPIVDNHMICTIKLDGKYIFLDGTDPSCIFGIPSSHIQGKQAMLAVNDTSYIIERVPVPEKTVNRLVDSTYLEFKDKELKGKTRITLSGYYSIDIHNSLRYVNGKDREDYFKKVFKRGSNKFILGEVKYPDLSDKGQVKLEADFRLNDYARMVAGDIYVNLNLFRFYEHEEIDYPKRKSPIENDFRNIRTYVTLFRIPEGYKVSFLPRSKEFHNAIWGFSLRYEVKDNYVVLVQEFENNHLLLMPDQFKVWNEVLEQLFPLYKETVSLSKINEP